MVLVELRFLKPQSKTLALPLQPRTDFAEQAFSQIFITQIIKDISDEGFRQESPRLGQANTALAHIEERTLIKLPNRITMGASDIIGVDFKLWL